IWVVGRGRARRSGASRPLARIHGPDLQCAGPTLRRNNGGLASRPRRLAAERSARVLEVGEPVDDDLPIGAADLAYLANVYRLHDIARPRADGDRTARTRQC